MKVTVVPYKPEWAEQFQLQKRIITELLGDLAQVVEHIGSTAVPELPAKPVIDIQVGLRSLAEFDSSNVEDDFAAQGFIHRRDLQEMTPFRRFFKREDHSIGTNTNLHLVEIDHPWWNRHLLLRDYLRESSSARNRYGELKLELCKNEWRDVNHYNEAKEKLIWSLEDEAFQHFQISEAELKMYHLNRS